MKKQVLFMFLAAVAVAASQACATTGYGSLPAVVAANAAMPYQILAASQMVQPLYGQPYGQYGNVPICRLQDLAGLPPISVSQPVIVRVSKSKGHQAKDIFGGAAIGAGLGYLSGGAKAAAVGAGAGAGGGMLVANHEPADLCLLLPIKAP